MIHSGISSLLDSRQQVISLLILSIHSKSIYSQGGVILGTLNTKIQDVVPKLKELIIRWENRYAKE